MAIFNEILAGRFNKALVKLFNMKSAPAAPAAALGSEIIPAIQMYYANECRVLEGWQRFAAAFSAAAGGAGNMTIIQVLNPAGSKTVVVFEKALFSNNNAATTFCLVTYGITGIGIGGGSGQSNVGLDNRGIPSSTLLATSKNNTAAGQNGIAILKAPLLANTNLELIVTDDQELTLLPGSFYQFGTNTLNQSVDITVTWRERPLEDSELSL